MAERSTIRPEQERMERPGEAQRERGRHLEHLVVPAAPRRERIARQLRHRLLADAEIVAAAGERVVRAGDRAGRADAAAGGELDRPVLARVERRDAAHPGVRERLERGRPRVEEGEAHAGRQVARLRQGAPGVNALYPRETRARRPRRQPEVEVEAERLPHLLGEEGPEGTSRGIDPPDQLALVPAEAHAVVAVALARPPDRALARDGVGELVEV